VATFTSIFDVALLVGAPAVGFLIEGFDYLVAFAAAGVLLVVGSLVYRVWDRRIDPASLIVEEAI
jgi:predicted MFS family arabinose efflux permease